MSGQTSDIIYRLRESKPCTRESHDLNRAAADEIERLRKEIADLRCSVIAFGGPWAVEYARDFGLPSKHLHSTHYDILARAGARMDDFVRHEDADGE